MASALSSSGVAILIILLSLFAGADCAKQEPPKAKLRNPILDICTLHDWERIQHNMVYVVLVHDADLCQSSPDECREAYYGKFLQLADMFPDVSFARMNISASGLSQGHEYSTLSKQFVKFFCPKGQTPLLLVLDDRMSKAKVRDDIEPHQWAEEVEKMRHKWDLYLNRRWKKHSLRNPLPPLQKPKDKVQYREENGDRTTRRKDYDEL